MEFDLFKKLYEAALKEGMELEDYIAGIGYQGWMDGYNPEEVRDILTKIYILATNPLKSTREGSQKGFSEQYSIPLRTLQSWDMGEYKIKAYTKMLIDFAQFSNQFGGNEKLSKLWKT